MVSETPICKETDGHGSAACTKITFVHNADVFPRSRTRLRIIIKSSGNPETGSERRFIIIIASVRRLTLLLPLHTPSLPNTSLICYNFRSCWWRWLFHTKLGAYVLPTSVSRAVLCLMMARKAFRKERVNHRITRCSCVFLAPITQWWKCEHLDMVLEWRTLALHKYSPPLQLFHTFKQPGPVMLPPPCFTEGIRCFLETILCSLSWTFQFQVTTVQKGIYIQGTAY